MPCVWHVCVVGILRSFPPTRGTHHKGTNGHNRGNASTETNVGNVDTCRAVAGAVQVAREWHKVW
eukprot:scaffold324_cov326-Pavlova_lutheri.AAC.14